MGQAELVFRQRLADISACNGEEHPAWADAAMDLARVLESNGKNDEAIHLLRQAVSVRKARFGADANQTIEATYRHAVALADSELLHEEPHRKRKPCYEGSGRPKPPTDKGARAEDSAAGLLEHVVDSWTQRLGEAHPDTLAAVRDLAALRRMQGEWRQAVRLYRRLHQGYRVRSGAEDNDALYAATNLAEALLRLHELRDVEGFTATRLAVAPEGPQEWAVSEPRPNYPGRPGEDEALLMEMLHEAEALYRAALETYALRHGDTHRRTADCAYGLGILLQQKTGR